MLGPALPGGELVRGKIVGLMMMEDEKGLDSKVVLSPLDGEGNPLYALTPADQDRIAAYFRTYKAADNGPATSCAAPATHRCCPNPRPPEQANKGLRRRGDQAGRRVVRFHARGVRTAPVTAATRVLPRLNIHISRALGCISTPL